MRVLLVTDWPATAGGVETYLLALASGLREAGDEVALLASGVGAGAVQADYVAYGARRAVPQAVLQVANPFAAGAVRRAVRHFRPDVAHVSMFEMHLSPSAVTALGGLPTILNVAYYKPICPTGLKLLPDGTLCRADHGRVCLRGCVGPAHWLRDRARYARIRSVVEAAADVVTCSRWMAGELGRAGIPASWIPWPVAAPSRGFRPERAQEPTLVYVGRLSTEKGVETLLRASARVLGAGRGHRLRLVGDGPLRGELERLAAELGLGDRAEFVGAVAPERVEDELAGAWALVVPSLWAEPLGLVAIEAIVRGIPVVASAAGGLGETVEPGVTGLLFPNGDVVALAERLLHVLDGTAFPAGVLPEPAVARVRERHDLGRHAALLRERLQRIAA
jgi:glycosyltransferase involved in cell wall biosynthesis